MNASPLDRVLAKFPDAQPAGKNKFGNDEWKARCSAHDDQKASLSIGTGNDGRVLLHCHTKACTNEAIVQSIGLTLADLMPPKDRPAPAAERWKKIFSTQRILAEYDYIDADGQRLYQSLRVAYDERNETTGETRHVPKDFTQRRLGEKGGWVWKMAGVNYVLYQLPKVQKAASEGKHVVVVEGEKDVLALEKLGFVATTNVGGAGKWKPEYTESLHGAQVVVLPDNDEPGRKHAQIVAAAVQGVAASVRIVELPGLPPKGDVSDWLDQSGHDAAALREIAKSAPFWTKPPLNAAERASDATNDPDSLKDLFHTTDYGNAERLVKRHGRDLRFCSGMGWLVWDGKRWQSDETGEVMRRAKETVRFIFSCAAQLEKEAAALTEKMAAAEDEERETLKRRQSIMAARAKDLTSWAFKSEAAGRLEAAITLAETEKGIPVFVKELDTDPRRLNCQNGTLNLKTGELLPHERTDLITRICNVSYVPDAPCPLWFACLERWQPSAEMRAFLQRAGGYTLSGLTGEETAFFTYGTGGNGKSKFVGALEYVMGGYATRLRVDVLMESKKDAGGTTPDLVDLPGARLVIVSEVEAHHRLKEGFIKDLTGNERINVNPKHQKVFRFDPVFKLWLYGNHKPGIRGTDAGIRRRFPLIPFTVSVPPGEADPDLKEKLEAEGEGILAWFVQGFAEYQKPKVRLSPPSDVIDATTAYHADQDVLKGFFDTCCIFQKAEGRGKPIWTPTASIRAALEEYCEGEGLRPPSANDLAERLTREGCETKTGRFANKVVRGWENIGLITFADSQNVDTVDTVDGDFYKVAKAENINSRREYTESAVNGVNGVNKKPEGVPADSLYELRGEFESDQNIVELWAGRVVIFRYDARAIKLFWPDNPDRSAVGGGWARMETEQELPPAVLASMREAHAARRQDE